MEILALAIGGFVASIFAELVKAGLKIKDTTAVIMCYVVALITTLGGGYLLGEITSFSDVIGQSLIIFGIATLVYKLLIKSFTK